MSDEILVWIDTETFGLVPEECPIIEIGFVVTDLDLHIIGSYSRMIWEPWYDVALDNLISEAAKSDASSAKLVHEMHKRSFLWEQARVSGDTIDKVRSDLMQWLTTQGVNTSDPMCGSSVQFDRQMLAYWMPELHDMFSYRNIDISTLKELCRRYNPPIYMHLQKDVIPKKSHRVIDDLDDTIAEFKFYRDEFLMWKD